MFEKTANKPMALNDEDLNAVVGGSLSTDQEWDFVDINVNDVARARGGAGSDVLVGGLGNDLGGWTI